MMRLGESMNRLGTESAFEVLARTRVLEAQGCEVIHLEDFLIQDRCLYGHSETYQPQPRS